VWLAEFDKLRLPYNINSLTQASAGFALKHKDVLDEQAARLRAERARLLQELAALAGVQVWPSAANFILFRTAKPADAVFAALREHGVLIKNLSGAGGASPSLRTGGRPMPVSAVRILPEAQQYARRKQRVRRHFGGLTSPETAGFFLEHQKALKVELVAIALAGRKFSPISGLRAPASVLTCRCPFLRDGRMPGGGAVMVCGLGR
jgi:hypothetical protein